jgi:uncharacterized iron-regulated membrane protein
LPQNIGNHALKAEILKSETGATPVLLNNYDQGNFMTSHLNQKSSSGPKHRLLAQSRQWHKWGGLIAGIFILVVAASGIVLNYKKPVFAALGIEQGQVRTDKVEQTEKGATAKGGKLKFSTGNGLSALPVSMERALEIARGEWGNVELERIELKSERGETLYKLKKKGGTELWVNAVTGSYFEKGEYERVGKADASGAVARSTDWGKILIDLHTGKIGGEVGKAVMSVMAVMLLLLTFSGFYMWLKPLLIRRENKSRTRSARQPGRSIAAVVSGVPKPELVEV